MACVLDKFRQTRQSSSREKSLNAIKSIPAGAEKARSPVENRSVQNSSGPLKSRSCRR